MQSPADRALLTFHKLLCENACLRIIKLLLHFQISRLNFCMQICLFLICFPFLFLPQLHTFKLSDSFSKLFHTGESALQPKLFFFPFKELKFCITDHCLFLHQSVSFFL